jgi:hypothetical protein
MVKGADYCDESLEDFERETMSRMPCCILKDVMHGKEH